MLLKIFAALMTLVFLSFAIVQYNDPDPWLWIPIYLVPMVMSFLFVLNRGSRPVLLVLAILFLAGAIYTWPAQWEGVALQNGMKTINIEEGRESLGLAVAFVALLILYFGRGLKRPLEDIN